MDEKLVLCPYCGQQINNNDEKCPNCGEFFVEPNLSEFRLISIPLFLVFESILSSFGFPFFYSLIWILFNHNNICKIAIEKDLKKFKILFVWFCIFVLLTIIVKVFVLIDVILEIFITYRILRIIEKFTLKKYNSPVTHHEVGMIFFRTLYLVYYIDTYLIRVKDPNLRYCLDIDKWFKYLIILAVILGLLYLWGMLSIPFIIN